MIESEQEQRTQLLAMGFDASDVEEALTECPGNLDAAVNLIVTRRTKSPPSNGNSDKPGEKSTDEISLSVEQLTEYVWMLALNYVAATAKAPHAHAASNMKMLPSIKPKDSSVGLCTRKDEFFAKLNLLDPLVQELSSAASEDDRDRIAERILKENNIIECLIRYREPSLASVFLKLLNHDKWSIRARALYGLKMVGGRRHVAPIARVLHHDQEPQVREQAASALGHIGGSEALATLQSKLANEEHPYVRATIVASNQLARLDTKPFPSWNGPLDGMTGARRVAWQWQVKGQASFNLYDCKSHGSLPVAEVFCYPVSWYKQDLFTNYPRKSFGAGGNHAGEDCAWFREGCSLYAIADGLVRMVQGAGGDWGFLIVIEHRLANGEYITSVYGHAASDVLVEPGDFVTRGQKIGSQGLSCSAENGGYGSHLHFGLGLGPFRRSAKVFIGGPINLNMNGADIPCKVARFGYSEDERNRFGWPRINVLVALPDGTGRRIVMPAEELHAEVSWLQAYVPNCRGWLDPQRWLPDHVKGAWDTC